MSERKIYFKILLAITLGMIVVVVGFRAFVIVMGAGGPMGRVTEAREALPTIVKEDNS